MVASDLALSMLTQDAPNRPPAVVGDVLALPFRSGAFDLSVASFVLNHLPDPASGMREMCRVVRRGGPVLVTSFEGQPTHPAKTAVDRVAEGFGFSAPAWYVAFKRADAPAVASADALAAAAREAGLPDVVVERVVVRPGGLTTADLVDWRLGMAHLAGFVAGLGPRQQEALRTEAIAALSVDTTPLELVVLVLLAR